MIEEGTVKNIKHPQWNYLKGVVSSFTLQSILKLLVFLYKLACGFLPFNLFERGKIGCFSRIGLSSYSGL